MPLPLSSTSAVVGWVVPSMTTGWLMNASSDCSVIVGTLPPGMLKTIVSRSPPSASDSASAFRSEPGPLSLVFVTAMLRLPGVTVVVSNAELLPGVGSSC